MGLFNWLSRKKDLTLYKSPASKCVAIAYGGNGTVPVFEQTRYVEFYVVENNKKKQKQMISLGPVDMEGRIKLLKDMKTDYVVARNFGPRAMHELKRYGITACLFDGGPGAAFKAYLNGTLKSV